MKRGLIVAWVSWASSARAASWELVDAQRATAVAELEGAWRAEWFALVEDLARHAPSGRVPADAAARALALGLTLTVDVGGLVVSDATEPRRGLPVVLLRLGSLQAELVVQAPHPYADLHTGRIVADLYDLGEARAAVIHTTRRDAGPGADPAHAAEGAFQGATDALAQALADPLFVQLHGFGEHTTEAAAVVSAGRSVGSDELRAKQLLAAAFGGADVRTGEEVPALAAATNSQARLLDGRARFLHVELALAVRVDLRARPEELHLLNDTLVDLASREVAP